MNKILVEVSAKHCHLSKEDIKILFGESYQLTKLKQLTQPSDFACKETIDIKLGEKEIKNIRVVAPEREKTQVEISLTDAVGSGVIVPIKMSGDLNGSAGAVLIGPAGQVEIKEGVIVAMRHIHCSPTEAKKMGFKNGDNVSVKVKGDRSIIFEDVAVRTGEEYKLCLHLDTDEGNSAGINKTGEGIIL